MKKKILIVDDEPYLIDILERMLEHLGYASVAATNGKEAVDMAAAQLPDVILLDISLPDMGGLEIARLIRQNPKTQSTPIIAVTGNTSLNDKDECFEAGFDDFISKPFASDQVGSSIKTLLSK